MIDQNKPHNIDARNSYTTNACDSAYTVMSCNLRYILDLSHKCILQENNDVLVFGANKYGQIRIRT